MADLGTQFTCFTSTRVQILTQNALDIHIHVNNICIWIYMYMYVYVCVYMHGAERAADATASTKVQMLTDTSTKVQILTGGAQSAQRMPRQQLVQKCKY